MYCSSCGVQNEDGSLFCSNCGSRLDSSSEQPAKQMSNYDESSYYAQPPNQPNYVENQYSNQDYIFQSQPKQQYNQPPVSSSYQYQNEYNQTPYGQYQVEDKINPILYILSFILFPIGLIVYFANKQTKPRSSKNIAITTVIGFFILYSGFI